jgi:ribosomal protein L7/L12
VDYGVWWVAVAGVCFGLALGASGSSRRVRRIEGRLAQVERKLAAVLARSGAGAEPPLLQTPLPPQPGLDQVHAFLREGKKIQAIKVYREITGVGLKDAKDAVERIAGER